MKRLLPSHIPGTARAWRIKKRREARALTKAANTFLRGAAYTPLEASRIEHEIRVAIDRLRQALRGNWKPCE